MELDNLCASEVMVPTDMGMTVRRTEGQERSQHFGKFSQQYPADFLPKGMGSQKLKYHLSALLPDNVGILFPYTLAISRYLQTQVLSELSKYVHNAAVKLVPARNAGHDCVITYLCLRYTFSRHAFASAGFLSFPFLS